MKKVANNRSSKWPVVILGSFFVFKMFYSLKFPITADEAYYWEWSRNLAAGYYDHPPLVGWLVALTRFIGRITGGAELFWVRLPALLSVTGVLIIVYLLLVQVTGEKRMGIYGVVFLLVTPLFSTGANVITPDQPLIFFSALTLYFLYQVFFTGRTKFWYYAGITMGCAFLSKFMSILLIPGLILFLIISPEDRFWLKRKEPYLFVLLAGIMYLPNLIWNANHDWITYLFNLSSRHSPQFSLSHFAVFLAGQMVVIGPVLFLILAAGLLWGAGQWPGKGDRKPLFFSLMAIPVFGFFGIIGFFEDVGAHWTVTGIVPAVIVLFYYYNQIFNRKKLKRLFKLILYIGLVLSLFITVSIHLLIVYNHLIPGEINLAGQEVRIEPSWFRFFYGWKETGEHISDLQQEYGEEVFLITPQYAISSMLSYNTPGQPFIRVFAQEYLAGLNYIFWNEYDKLEGRNAIFISLDMKDSYLQALENSFEEVEKLEGLEIYNPAGHKVKTFDFFYCRGFNGRDMTTSSDIAKYIP